mgnify:CR=1 FL=1
MELQEEKLSRAISAFSRRKILHLLADESMTVKDIAHQTKMSVSLASRHLKFLYDLGFLSVEKKYPHKYYSLKVKEIRNLLTVYDRVIQKL